MNTGTQPCIAFQGGYGAYSDLACRTAYPSLRTLPCPTFEDAFIAVHEGRADFAMIPIDNTLAGRVADVHRLIPRFPLSIVAEHFQPIRHALAGMNGADLRGITDIYSHVHALPQCRNLIKRLNARTHVWADTAAAAEHVAALKDPAHAAIASRLAADIHGLSVLEDNVQDASHNTTRFVVFAREAVLPPVGQTNVLTSLMFDVRNIPAALYKALGGFATNGLQLAKLESYVDEHFSHARFYVEVEGHQQSAAMKNALDELRFYANELRILGTYAAHEFRLQSAT